MSPAEALKSKLEGIGIAHTEIRVFGVIRCNIHVECLGKATADKWASVLSSVSRGSGGKPASVSEVSRPNVVNRGTCLRPTMHRAYLVGVAF